MKKSYHIYMVMAALLGFAPAFAQQPAVVTLDYCQKQAMTSYPSAKNKELLQAASSLRITNVKSGMLPQLTLNGQATYQSQVIDIPIPAINFQQPKDQYKATVDVNQLLFDGGTIRFQKKLEESSVAADVQQVEVDLYKLKEQVNNVYFLLLTLQESSRLLHTTLNEIVEREKVVSSSVKNGVLTPSDLDVLTAEKLSVEQQLSEIEINRKSSLSVLALLIDQTFSDSTKFELPTIAVDDTFSQVRPEYKLFELQAERMDDSKQLTRTSLMPKVYAFAQGGYARPGLNMLSDKFNSYYLLGASIKWTIFDWNKNSRERKVMDVQKQMVTTQQEVFEKNLKIDLANRLSAIQKMEDAITRDSLIVELRTRVAVTSASRLENGVITSTDYLTDLNAETMAKINMETHKIQLVQAKANYMVAKGSKD